MVSIRPDIILQSLTIVFSFFDYSFTICAFRFTFLDVRLFPFFRSALCSLRSVQDAVEHVTPASFQYGDILLSRSTMGGNASTTTSISSSVLYTLRLNLTDP